MYDGRRQTWALQHVNTKGLWGIQETCSEANLSPVRGVAKSQPRSALIGARGAGDNRREDASAAGVVGSYSTFGKINLNAETPTKPGEHVRAPRGKLAPKFANSALRNMVVKGGSQRQNTFMGVDNAVVCLSVVLININPHQWDLAL